MGVSLFISLAQANVLAVEEIKESKQKGMVTFPSSYVNHICGLPIGLSESLSWAHCQGTRRVFPPRMGGHCKVMTKENEEARCSWLLAAASTSYKEWISLMITGVYRKKKISRDHSINNIFISTDEYKPLIMYQVLWKLSLTSLLPTFSWPHADANAVAYTSAQLSLLFLSWDPSQVPLWTLSLVFLFTHVIPSLGLVSSKKETLWENWTEEAQIEICFLYTITKTPTILGKLVAMYRTKRKYILNTWILLRHKF